MKPTRFLLILMVMVCLVTSCRPRMYRKVAAGRDATVFGLPRSDAYAVVATLNYEVDRDWGEGTCYIGEALIALGTHLSEKEALLVYVELLEAHGWVVERPLNERDTSCIMFSGDNEEIRVTVGNPGFPLTSEESFQQAKDLYPVFVRLGIFYYLPHRKACLGE